MPTLPWRTTINWSNILRASRIAQALGIAFFLTIILAWWKLQGDPGKLVESYTASGTVEKVYEKAYTVLLENGSTVKVIRNADYEQGATVTLTVNRYTSGDEFYSLPDTADIH